MPEILKSQSSILLTVHTSVREDVLCLKVIYLFFSSVENVIRDIIHRFLKALFLLVLLVHTWNKVILRSQIVTVGSPHWKIDDVNQCEPLLLGRKYYSGV
jgi:hypothetical protein